VNDHFGARRLQVQRHRLAHQAEADEADFSPLE